MRMVLAGPVITAAGVVGCPRHFLQCRKSTGDTGHKPVMCRPSGWPNCILAETIPSGACSDDWLATAPTDMVPRHAARRHGAMGDRAFASATELSNEIRDRHIGCVELLDFYLARAERYNPALNAIVVWRVDNARERARAADAALARGERWGPLHGIPMTVKESFNVAGLPTTFGNPLWKDNIATGNAFMIDRLLQAGAIIFARERGRYPRDFVNVSDHL